jgi:glycosyltransferase 2 family protein
MKKNLILGILLSAVLVWLSVRGIRFQDVADGFRSIRYGYIVPALLGMLVMQVLRSWRWGLILKPLEAVRPWTVFEVSNVGFLAITALPARLGELVRPYLIAQKSGVRMTAALGTILVERVMDGMTVLLLAMASLLWTPFPPWLVRSGILFGTAMLGLILLMIFLSLRKEFSLQAADIFLRRLPDRLAAPVRRMIHHFIDGFRIVRDVRLLLQVGALSLVIWIVDVAIIYAMFGAFSLSLPATAALIVMVVLLIGIAIPTAPGFIGNWHYACIVGLGLFGIPRAEALPFAVVYHFISVLLIAILGLAFLPFVRFSLADLQRQMGGGGDGS